MNAETAAFAPGVHTGWIDWLRRELAPFPGRDRATIRIVVTIVLVVIISMALRVPEALLSAYMVLFATKENKTVTTLTGVLLLIGVTIAIVASLLLYRFTLDFPELRIPSMAAVLFLGFFFSRVFAIGPLAFGVGFIIALTQSVAELEPSAEALVRSLLWLSVAIAYPIALTAIVNEYLLPEHPHASLLEGLQGRLDATIRLIERKLGRLPEDEQANNALRQMAVRGNAALFKLLALSEKSVPRLREQHTAQRMMIAATERLAMAAAHLSIQERETLTPNDRQRLDACCAEAAHLRAALQHPASILPPSEAVAMEAKLPDIGELQRSLALLRQGVEGAIPASPEQISEASPRKHLLAADAFTNPAHVHFALKVTLATMVCYILYTAVDWAGIHTAFITCCFISLESTGATQRKGTLRLVGCLVGGLLGLLSILYLVPHMESIASLAMLVAVVSFIAGWVAMGSERIAYAGLQIGLAFFMCVLQNFEQDIDLTKIRDRVVGIIFGIAVTTVVFRYVWPERATERLRQTLAAALRDLARLLTRPPLQTSLEKTEVWILRSEITAKLDQAFRFAEDAEFEADETRPLEDLITWTQNIYLTAALLTNEAALFEWQRLSTQEQIAEREFRSAVASRLDRAAALLTDEPLPERVNLDAHLAAWERVAESPPQGGRTRLLRQLTTQAHQVG